MVPETLCQNWNKNLQSNTLSIAGRQNKMKNLSFTINVTAGETITGVGTSDFYEGGFADGPMFNAYTESGRITRPGVFKTLEDIAYTIKFALGEEMKGLTNREK